MISFYGTIIAIILFSFNLSFAQGEIIIPGQNDWVDQGVVINRGAENSWDYVLTGMISPCTVVKKNGTIFLYYIGADGYRSSDGGPRHRALGVATSTDGLNFTKYTGNPIITFLPNNNEEEGIFSAGAVIGPDSNIYLFYGAMTAPDSIATWVTSDVRLAVSSDGYNFTDQGVVLSYSDPSVWGYGDELFPVGVTLNDSTWNVFYIAKGSGGVFWDLALASGSSPLDLETTVPVITDGSFVVGGGGSIKIDSASSGLFLVRDFTSPVVEVREFSDSSLPQVSLPIEVYAFNNFMHMTVFLDYANEKWLMFNGMTNDDQIHLRTAPLQSVLPVELLSFDGNILGNNVQLKWITSSELNNMGFSVERKFLNESHWREIGFVEGNGTTSNMHTYTFTDELNGTQEKEALYRLKQVNFDGTINILNTISLVIPKLQSYLLEPNYPNPFNPSTKISFNIPEDNFVKLKVFNILGEEVTTLINEHLKAGYYQVNFDASGLQTGVYFYRLKTNNFIDTGKMILAK